MTYSGMAVSYCSAVRAVITITQITTAVSLSAIVVRCEGRSNQHNITYRGIDHSQCSAVRAVLTITKLPTAASLSVTSLR